MELANSPSEVVANLAVQNALPIPTQKIMTANGASMIHSLLLRSAIAELAGLVTGPNMIFWNHISI